MKKLIISAFCAIMSIAAIAAGAQYQVYKITMNVKTTDAKGVVTSSSCCGTSEEYCYRENKTVKIQGLLAGCGCNAIKANGSCSNAILYMWDATRGIAITNIEVTLPWTVQRIGKKMTGIEHFAGIKATYGEDDRYSFEIQMAGVGTYANYDKDANLSYVKSISGNFAGISVAPVYFKAGKCSACYSEPDTILETQAFEVCTACSDGLAEAEYSNVVPFFGTYTVSYDSSRSNKISKKGLSASNLNLPSYVGITDYVATNIGE